MTTYNSDYSAYITQNFATEDDALRNIRSRLADRGQPTYSINPEEGRFLQCLAAMSGAGHALEFGTLGGYSGVWIARGLKSEGHLITVEAEAPRVEVAHETFRQAGVADRVEVIHGDALKLLTDLNSRGPFDLVFMDTSVSTYFTLFEWAMGHIRSGGIIAAHNAFHYGSLMATSSDDPMKRFNQRFASEQRLTSLIYPAGDGMLFGVFQPQP